MYHEPAMVAASSELKRQKSKKQIVAQLGT